MITLRRADDRGRTDFGWLDSRHSFSFGEYYDPAHMGFRSLRVINDDRVAGGGGFSPHPHRDMEIFSYVLEGNLEHQDSMGNRRTLKPGEVQLMSAGTGVTHGEYNPNKDIATRFLQIWIQPERKGLTPSYTEWHPAPAHAEAAKVLVISPDGRDGSATIHQDAFVYRIQMKAGEQVEHDLAAGRGLWLQIMTGSGEMNGNQLAEGDGANTTDAGTYAIRAKTDVSALLFDLK
jgi:redox-sensitive bicupin YhaK (pirin superfamily)